MAPFSTKGQLKQPAECGPVSLKDRSLINAFEIEPIDKVPVNSSVFTISTEVSLRNAAWTKDPSLSGIDSNDSGGAEFQAIFFAPRRPLRLISAVGIRGNGRLKGAVKRQQGFG